MTDLDSDQESARMRAINERLAPHINRLIDAVCPVYQADARGQPSLVGSGVGLRVKDTHFLVTAAHVMDHADRGSLYLGGGDTILDLGGEFFHTSPATGNRADDRFDLAVFPLSAAVAERVGPAHFIDDHEVRRTEIPKHVPGARSRYQLVGYPRSKQPRQMSEGSIRANPFFPIVLASEHADYGAFGGAHNTHLILEFDRKDFVDPNGPRVAPDPHGMSGGGVWLIENMVGDAEPEFRFVGTMIEYHVGQSLLLATRVGAVLDLIAARFPELRSRVELLL